MKLFESCIKCLATSVGISLLILAGSNFTQGVYVTATMVVQIPFAVLLIHASYAHKQ